MEKVTFTQEGKLGIVTIDSPPVNALEQQVLDELDQIVTNMPKDVDVVIVTGAGGKAFVAGADIKDFPELKKETGIELVKKGQRIFDKIAALEQPVIAAIDGFALGGGLELALACDIRIASKRSKVGFPEVNLGILPGYGGTQRLPRLIGPGKAKQLIFSGDPLSAEEAKQAGILEEVTEDSPMEKAKELAETIAKRAPLGVRKAKKAIDEGLNTTLEEGLHIEAVAFGELCDTEDKNEGVAAFFEKRQPNFSRK
ncbi:enoyl-CoA hydratase/isomerase family protein [Pueribacillus theae]|uniref:enoyl-CoA hydratase/isomerase family protein n=1 Tax=Pueribacillus theae TaxID=2171751 RepID=UPI0023E8BDBF|nr:enoyl-CoA hydratase-related protein [Pueribacillus theae]